MDNEAVVRRAIEAVWNCGDLAVADELFDAAYVNHDGLIPDLVRGPEAIKITVALYRTAFPDLHIAVDDLHSDGDTVVVSWTAWRHGPSAIDDDATARQLLLRGITRNRLHEGKIAESWTQWDRTELLRRFGDDPDPT